MAAFRGWVHSTSGEVMHWLAVIEAKKLMSGCLCSVVQRLCSTLLSWADKAQGPWNHHHLPSQYLSLLLQTWLWKARQPCEGEATGAQSSIWNWLWTYVKHSISIFTPLFLNWVMPCMQYTNTIIAQWIFMCAYPGLIPGLGRSPGEGIGYPLQYSWVSLVARW